ncbi:MAG: thiol-disulfide isomerase/thioredoxin [Glaciecola sp.]|jgi:thiol-disulfide isomerase/thioredoxin
MTLRLGIVLAVVLLAWASARFFTRRDGTVVSSQDRLSPSSLASLNLPVVDVPYRAVLFGSPTCGPCDAVKRVLLEVEAERGDFTWRYVDTADHLDVAESLAIRRVPTLVLMDGDGIVRARTSGVPSPTDLHAVLDGQPRVLAG